MTGHKAPGTQFGRLDSADLVAQVRDKLVAAICNGELKPGERIVEAELARRMGISRGPVREAARLLQQWGILTAEARRGFFVRRVSLDEIDQISDHRICLESYAARKAAKQAKPRDIKKLRALYDDVVAAEGRRAEDPLAALEHAYTFHRFIFELGGNPKLSEAFDNLLVQQRQIATLINIADEASEHYFRNHLVQIVEAFEKGDPERVSQAVTRYLAFSCEESKKFYIAYCRGI